ncbi:hypothetical protein MT1_2729 [Pseudomonas sp. MT-1]|nr:hypothetical protein MT1_2729 [Pseudomonas sp. MT-1]
MRYLASTALRPVAERTGNTPDTYQPNTAAWFPGILSFNGAIRNVAFELQAIKAVTLGDLERTDPLCAFEKPVTLGHVMTPMDIFPHEQPSPCMPRFPS